jgi:hypothetical protein
MKKTEACLGHTVYLSSLRDAIARHTCPGVLREGKCSGLRVLRGKKLMPIEFSDSLPEPYDTSARFSDLELLYLYIFSILSE